MSYWIHSYRKYPQRPKANATRAFRRLVLSKRNGFAFFLNVLLKGAVGSEASAASAAAGEAVPHVLTRLLGSSEKVFSQK